MEEKTLLEEQNIEQTDVLHKGILKEGEDDFDYGPPRGTIAFLALMLTGYIIYYVIHYIEIFVLR